MNGQDLLHRIQESPLRGDQVRIAGTITGHLHRTAFLTGPELARECGVSVSAITRFAQKLGYRGYGELKQAMEVLYRKTITPYERFEKFLEESNGRSVLDLTLQQDMENITRINTFLDQETFKEAISWLTSADLIYLSAIGVSEILVDYLAAFLKGFDRPHHMLKSFGITRQAEIIDFKSDQVLFCFSFQRIFKEVVELCVYAKRYQVKILCLTDSITSPLAQASDIVLVSPVLGSTFGLSLAAPISMVNLIVNSIALTDPEKCMKAMEKARRLWQHYPIFCMPDENTKRD
ncbi:MurR/RpiR family transcriptional regulator [candidate division CSSED10-310 bacterium]|uniref:MurR/RpiR family transcriptional regulator n=1 Tax=candidate division CSSED10-310 bacterium TaxID=2855610 RepID=A0ABV6YYN3_UNCC1